MRSAVFMSIKEIHINRILAKIKNHEFRTKKPMEKISIDRIGITKLY